MFREGDFFDVNQYFFYIYLGSEFKIFWLNFQFYIFNFLWNKMFQFFKFNEKLSILYMFYFVDEMYFMKFDIVVLL